MPVKKDDFSAFDKAVNEAKKAQQPSKKDDFSAFDNAVKAASTSPEKKNLVQPSSKESQGGGLKSTTPTTFEDQFGTQAMRKLGTQINKPSDIITGQQKQQQQAAQMKAELDAKKVASGEYEKAKEAKVQSLKAKAEAPSNKPGIDYLDFAKQDIINNGGGSSLQAMPSDINSLNKYFDNNAENATDYFNHRLQDIDNQIKDLRTQNMSLINEREEYKKGDVGTGVQKPLVFGGKPIAQTTSKDIDDNYSKINQLTEYRNNLKAASDKIATAYTAMLYPEASLEEKGKIKRKFSGDKSLEEQDMFERLGVPLTEEQKFQNSQAGIDVEKERLEQQYKGLPKDDSYYNRLADIYESEKALINQFPEYKKDQVGLMVAQLASEDPKLRKLVRFGIGNIDADMVDYLSSKYNIPKSDLQGLEYGDIPANSSVIGSLAKGVFNVGTGLLSGANRIVGTALGVDPERLTYVNKGISESGNKIFGYNPYQALETSPTVIDTNPNSSTYLQSIPNKKAGKYNYNLASIANTLAEGIGGFAGFIGGLRGVSAAGKGLGMLAEGAAGEDAAMTSYMVISGYENNYQDANRVMGEDASEPAKALFAITKGYIDALAFKVLPKDKIFGKSAVQESAEKELAKSLAGVDIKNINKDLLESKVSKVVKGILATAEETGHITAAMSVADASKAIVNAVMGEKGKTGEYLSEGLEGVKHSLIQTPLSMALPLGIMEGIKYKEHSNLYKENLYNAGLKPNEYRATIQQELAKGNVNENDAKSRLEVVDAMSHIVQSTPEVNPKTNKKLTHQQQVEYAYNRLKEIAAKAKSEDVKDDEALSSLYKSEAKNYADQRKSILEQEIKKTPEKKLGELADTEIVPTFEQIKLQIPQEELQATQDVITRMNNAEEINEGDISKAENGLYSALQAHPESAHLIEPLINKLNTYEFTTKTEVSTVTKKEPVAGTGKVSEPKVPVSKSLEQWEGNRATITDADGKETTGILRKDENGTYSLFNENGDKIASIGEAAITDRDISLPSPEDVPMPIELDKDGMPKSITLQLNRVNMEAGGVEPTKTIKIEFKDKEKALDYAIQLRAEQVGEVPDAAFEQAYREVQEQVSKEVPKYTEEELAKRKEAIYGKEELKEFNTWNNTNTEFSDSNIKNRKTFKDKSGNENTIGHSESDNTLYVQVNDSEGNNIASAFFDKDKDGNYIAREVFTEPNKRKEGIASAMYDYVDNNFGKIKKSKLLSKEGQKIWESNAGKVSKKQTKAQQVGEGLLSHLGLGGTTSQAPKIYTIDNINEVNKEGYTGDKKFIIDRVANVIKAINKLVGKSIGKKLTVTIHDSVDSFRQEVYNAMIRDKFSKEEALKESKDAGNKGFYASTDGSIHINMTKATKDTLLHEAFHPVLDYMAKNAPEVVDDLYNQLSKITGKKITEGEVPTKVKGEEFQQKAKRAYKGELTQKKEAITDFIAKVASGEFKIDATNFEKVRDFFVNMLRKLGMLKVYDKEITSIKDLKELSKLITEKFAKGEEINVEETSKPLTESPIEISAPKFNKDFPIGEKIKVGKHALSFVKENDLIDIESFLKKVSAEKKKVWFWVADQLGRGMYFDKVIDGEHYLDAGPSYALDPVNREKGIIWATGKDNEFINRNIKNSDYIFIISGSPEKSKLFNKRVFDLFSKRVGDFDKFKRNILKKSNVSELNSILKKSNSFEELKNSPQRKDFLIEIEDQKNKNTPLAEYLKKSNAFIDYNELRDGFYADNQFGMNDIMLILKPESIGGQSKHSTYENDIIGKVVGVPDRKINSYDLLPKELQEKYRLNQEEKNKQRALKGKAPVELGESQKSQIIAPYGSGIKEIQFSKEDNENEDIVTASVNIAPLYSTKVGNVEQAELVHNSELYQKYKQNNERLAKMFNLEVVSQEDGVGGYEFSNGDAVMEATTVVNVKGKFSDIVNYAAINGALTPEVQDATIAGMYVDASDKNHTADKVSVQVSDVDAAMKAAKDSGFDRAGFTLINDEISFFNVFYHPKESKKQKEITKDFENKISTFVNKFKEYGGQIIKKEARPVRSEYIDNVRRREILNGIESSGLYTGQGGTGLRDALAKAKERNTRYTTWKYLDKSETAKEYRKLRQLQFDLAAEGKSMTDTQRQRMSELEKRMSKPLTTTFKSEANEYDKAKLEIDAIASDVAGLIENGYKSEFPTKRPSRAAIKTVRWYDSQPNKLGDGARANVIVNEGADADFLYNELMKRFPSSTGRTEKVTTELGYPKRLIEIKTSNGKLAEIQIMTPQGYLAKDGVSHFPSDAKSKAEASLKEVRDRLGWNIPDGVGHYFYEINRDTNIPKDLRNEAREISVKYYEAFLDPTSKLTDAEFRKDITDFKQKVDAADKSKWDEGNKGESPETLNKYLKQEGVKVKTEKINWEKSLEGKGDPTISSRNPIVQEAAKNLKEGKITNEEYRAIVSENSPIRPITKFFEPATLQQIKNSFSVATKKESEAENIDKPVTEGAKVGLRLDIPSYKYNNTWVVSVHDGHTPSGKILSYTNVAKIKNVSFEPVPVAALNIATGEKSKTSVARMYGEWENIPGNDMKQRGDNAKKIVEDISNNPNWVQVGMNPFRHSYFYDRSSEIGRPIKSAEEVVQVGGLVYAKKPVYNEWTNEAYRVKGLLDAEKRAVQFSKEEETEGTLKGQHVKFIKHPEDLEVINGFYSPIEKRILETKANNLSANKWRELMGKGDEAKFTGVLDWLSSLPPTQQISKAEVKDWIANNRIEIKEVVKGEKISDEIIKDNTYNNIQEELYRRNIEDLDNVVDNWYYKEGSWSDVENFLDKENIDLDYVLQHNLKEPEEDTKYSQYQLPGEKENYKEVLITQPPIRNNVFGEMSSTLDYARDTYGKKSAEYDSIKRDMFNKLEENYGLSYEQVKELFNRYEKAPEVFKSSHYDEPNILAHLRMNTRTDAEGNKVLFLEEVQSDWGQKGKKEGFKKEFDENRYKELQNKLLNGIKKLKSEGKIEKDDMSVPYEKVLTSKESSELKSLEEAKTTIGKKIPEAPFVTDTNAWTKLGLKYALQQAVKEGADKIAWTTGEQQNERYDLSKQVDKIIIKKYIDNTYSVKGVKNKSSIFYEDNIPSEKLSDFIGKELSEKAIKEVDREGKTYEGKDLAIGGKGMIGFYGSPEQGKEGIVGNVAKALVKELTGKEGKIGETKIDLGLKLSKKADEKLAKMGWESEESAEKYNTQHSIDITPELKASVEAGLPQFSKGEEQDSKIKEYIDNQRKAGVSDEDIKAGIESVADKIGLDKSRIDSLMAGEVKPEVKPEVPTAQPAKETVSLKNKSSRQTRIGLNLPEVKLPKIGTDVEALAEGKRLIEEGEIDPDDVILKVLYGKGEVGMNPDESKAMLYHIAQLKAADTDLRRQIDDTENVNDKAVLSGKLQQLSDAMDAATEANVLSGRAWSESGRIRQINVDESFDVSREKFIIKDAYGGQVPKDVQERIDKIIQERDAAISERNKIEKLLRSKMAKESFEAMMKRANKLKNPAKEVLVKEEKDLLAKLKTAFQKDLNNLNAGIPIPKETIEVLGKLAVNYIKQGMVSLDAIVNKIHDQIKGDVPQLSKEDLKDIISNYQEFAREKETSNLTKKAERLEKKLTEPEKIAQPKKAPLVFRKNTEWVRANQRVANAEFKMKVEKRKALESQKNMYQKGLMWAGRAVRLSVLSGYKVLGKLASATVVGGAVKRLPEQAIGQMWAHVFRGVAEKAPIEGFTNAKAEAKFYKEFFNPKKFVQNSWSILSTGESNLNKKMGTGEYEHVPFLYLPTDLHQIIKDPLKRAAFESAFLNNLIWAEKNGLDINDDLVIQSIETACYKRANYEIFQEQTKLSKWFSQKKNQLERGGNIKSSVKFLIDFLVPVSTVPTNIVRRIFSYSPIGLIKGSVQVREAYRKGIENLSSEQADLVMRQLKQGSMGTALWCIGWFGASYFGGLYSKYNPDKKRLEGQLASDEMEVGGEMIPKPVQHALPLEVIQAAATMRHIYDNYTNRKNEGNFEALKMAALGSIGALFEQVPLFETGLSAGLALKEPYYQAKLQEDIKRRFEPQILRETGVIETPKKEKKGGHIGVKLRIKKHGGHHKKIKQ